MSEQIESFEWVFAADAEPDVWRFQIAGREAFIEFTPMGAGDSEKFATLGVETEIRDGKLAPTGKNIDISKRHEFLTVRTITDFCLWTRPRLKDGGRGDWQQVRPPENKRNLAQFLRDSCDFTPEFWRRIIDRCYTVNNLKGEQEGNSEP